MSREGLREVLAELEHDQWWEWAETLAAEEDLSDERVERWEDYFCPYSKLPERVKDHDRKWADEVLLIIEKSDAVEVCWDETEVSYGD